MIYIYSFADHYIDPFHNPGRSFLQCMPLVGLYCSSPTHHSVYQGFTALFVQCFLTMRVYKRMSLPFAD